MRWRQEGPEDSGAQPHPSLIVAGQRAAGQSSRPCREQMGCTVGKRAGPAPLSTSQAQLPRGQGQCCPHRICGVTPGLRGPRAKKPTRSTHASCVALPEPRVRQAPCGPRELCPLLPCGHCNCVIYIFLRRFNDHCLVFVVFTNVVKHCKKMKYLKCSNKMGFLLF